MSFEIQPGAKVLFTGDSITDNGRRADRAPLGGGYVRMVHDLIMSRYPEHGLTFVNTGISGNTVWDLTCRWTDDVILHQPDWLSIMIGINDIHRWFSGADGPSVDPAGYAKLYRALLERVKNETDAKLVLLDPFYISRDTHGDNQRARVLRELAAYREAVSELAADFGAKHIKLHDHFQRLLQNFAPDDLCPEPVHPNASGHLVMAHEWLCAFGF